MNIVKTYLTTKLSVADDILIIHLSPILLVSLMCFGDAYYIIVVMSFKGAINCHVCLLVRSITMPRLGFEE